MRLKNRLLIISIWFVAAMMALAACGGESDRAQTQDTPVQDAEVQEAKVADAAVPDAIAQSAKVMVREIVNHVEVNALHPETQELAFVGLQLGQSLQTDSLVKTHENSSARVDIWIENFTRVTRTAPGTIWELGSFALDGEAVIELQEGKIFLFDEDNGQENWPLHIETPSGTASARGTWMAVGFDPDTGEVTVECLRGVCELENGLGYQAFTNAQAVVASAGSGPTDPAPMNEAAIEAFQKCCPGN